MEYLKSMRWEPLFSVGFRFEILTNILLGMLRRLSEPNLLYLVAQKTVDTLLRMTAVPARRGAARSIGIKYIYESTIAQTSGSAILYQWCPISTRVRASDPRKLRRSPPSPN